MVVECSIEEKFIHINQQTYKKVSGYDQEIPQSHTEDQPTAQR